MLGLQLNHVSKRGQWCYLFHRVHTWCTLLWRQIQVPNQDESLPRVPLTVLTIKSKRSNCCGNQIHYTRCNLQTLYQLWLSTLFLWSNQVVNLEMSRYFSCRGMCYSSPDMIITLRVTVVCMFTSFRLQAHKYFVKRAQVKDLQRLPNASIFTFLWLNVCDASMPM